MQMVWSGPRIDHDAAWHYAEIKRRPDTSKVQDTYEIEDEYRSIVGMMAFAVEFNQPLVLLTPDEPSDFGEDFNIHGFKIDVKTTIHAGGKLVHRWGTRYDADVYVLATLDKDNPSSVKLVGWAWLSELLSGEVVDWGNRGKPCRILPQNKLRPMSDLVDDLAFERIVAA